MHNYFSLGVKANICPKIEGIRKHFFNNVTSMVLAFFLRDFKENEITSSVKDH